MWLYGFSWNFGDQINIRSIRLNPQYSGHKYERHEPRTIDLKPKLMLISGNHFLGLYINKKKKIINQETLHQIDRSQKSGKILSIGFRCYLMVVLVFCLLENRALFLYSQCFSHLRNVGSHIVRAINAYNVWPGVTEFCSCNIPSSHIIDILNSQFPFVVRASFQKINSHVYVYMNVCVSCTEWIIYHSWI